MEKPTRHTVTAALIYANGPVHIGHIAGCYLPADIYVRYLRSVGEDVAFISGTDEHGVPITMKAKNEGITPQAVVDKYYTIIKDSFDEFGIGFDIFSRTSNKTHHEMASGFFKKLYDDGVFTEQVTEQYYDEKTNTFLADRYIKGTCPKCSNPNAYGDQCEKCGSTLSPTELINPKSTLSGDKPVLKPTRNWFLPLDKLQPQIENYVEAHPEWKTNVTGQCKSWLKQGLQPRAMTRDLDWGVKVPIENTDGKVLYVWFDAPIGYITATKEWADQHGKDWEDYWKKKDTSLVHFIGKDNIVFHCIIFPAMLMAHGDYILADNVPANEFLNLEGEKLSTSRNWAIWLHEYLEELPGKQDELRYVLTSISPETKDSDFTWKDYQARVNNELVAILGNFVNRAFVLTQKYFEGKIPVRQNWKPEDEKVFQEVNSFAASSGENIRNYKFREGLSDVMNMARAGNKFLADTEPWKVWKEDQERVAEILHVSLEIIARIAIAMEPFMPFSSKRILKMCNKNELHRIDAESSSVFFEGDALGEVELLFEKIEDEMIEIQIQKLHKAGEDASQKVFEVAEAKPECSFDDFVKMDMRTGVILSAEKVSGADKLLKLEVDTGLDTRTIVSGIAEHFKPEEIIGKKVSVLVNLAPRKIRGVESKGMILMAENPEGKLEFINADSEIISGSVIR